MGIAGRRTIAAFRSPGAVARRLRVGGFGAVTVHLGPPWLARLRREVRVRLGAVRIDLMVAVQSGVAAGLAWLVATRLLHHHAPFFAPISAVIVLGSAAGQRWRRAFELGFGVALGIGVGDALVLLVGVGPVQIAAVVVLAILTAVFLGGGSVAMGQAASSAVLVATLAPPSGGIYFVRFFDALIGAVVGLLVMNLLLPFNPLTRVRRAAGSALTILIDALTEAAVALEERRSDRADRALDRLRSSDVDHARLRESLNVGVETATLAPIMRQHRPALARYTHASVHIDRVTRNVRVLERRVATAVFDDEPIPADLPRALRLLADAVATLRTELSNDRVPTASRAKTLDAVAASVSAYREGVGFSGLVVVAQLRSAAVDLLVATGVTNHDANQAVRRITRSHPAR